MATVRYDDMFLRIDFLVAQAKKDVADPLLDTIDRKQIKDWLDQLESWQDAQLAGRHELAYIFLDAVGVHEVTCVCGLEVTIVLNVDLGYQLEAAEGHRPLPCR